MWSGRSNFLSRMKISAASMSTLPPFLSWFGFIIIVLSFLYFHLTSESKIQLEAANWHVRLDSGKGKIEGLISLLFFLVNSSGSNLWCHFSLMLFRDWGHWGYLCFQRVLNRIKFELVSFCIGFASHRVIFGPAYILYDIMYSASIGLCHFVS